MDNGQQIQPNTYLAGSEEGQPFFTPGEGGENTENPDLQNSIQNESFNQDSNDLQKIGKNAMESKIINFESYNHQNTRPNDALNIPPSSPEKTNILEFSEASQKAEAPVPRIEKSGLNDAAYWEIRDSEEKLKKGDAAGFAEDIIDIRIRLLNNTYGPNSKAKDLQRRVREAA